MLLYSVEHVRMSVPFQKRIILVDQFHMSSLSTILNTRSITHEVKAASLIIPISISTCCNKHISYTPGNNADART